MEPTTVYHNTHNQRQLEHQAPNNSIEKKNNKIMVSNELKIKQKKNNK